MTRLPLRLLRTATDLTARVARHAARGTAEVAEAVVPLAGVATHNAAHAAAHVRRAADHRDRAYREADALISAQQTDDRSPR